MDRKLMFDLWMAPWKASLALTTASLDSMLTLQKSLLRFSSINMADGFDSDDETYMREAFQLAADANIRRWSDTAGMLQAMPDWYHTMSAKPGTVLTDMFDKARRKPV